MNSLLFFDLPALEARPAIATCRDQHTSQEIEIVGANAEQINLILALSELSAVGRTFILSSPRPTGCHLHYDNRIS